MLDGVRGSIHKFGPDYVVLMVGGWFVRVYVSNLDIEKIGEVSSEVMLNTSLQLREDSVTLYGFLSNESVRLFEQLVSVSGIGPRLALGFLSSYSPEDLIRIISNGDTALLTSISGVGARTASRVVLELKDKLETIQFENNILGSSSSNISEDALEALTALGYSRNEASRALVSVDSDTISEVEEKIRKALVYLNSL